MNSLKCTANLCDNVWKLCASKSSALGPPAEFPEKCTLLLKIAFKTNIGFPKSGPVLLNANTACTSGLFPTVLFSLAVFLIAEKGAKFYRAFRDSIFVYQKHLNFKADLSLWPNSKSALELQTK